MTPDGKQLVSASRDKTIKLWSLESGKEITTFDGHTDRVIDVNISPTPHTKKGVIPDFKVVTSITLAASPPSDCYRTTGTKDYLIETDTQLESSQVDELPVINEPETTTESNKFNTGNTTIESNGINENSILIDPTQLTEP
ncbi:hypothetical protein NUACC26_053770 [Scytonema sp. NUACC26]